MFGELSVGMRAYPYIYPYIYTDFVSLLSWLLVKKIMLIPAVTDCEMCLFLFLKLVTKPEPALKF